MSEKTKLIEALESCILYGTNEEKINAIAMVCINAYQTLCESQGDKYKKSFRHLEYDKKEVVFKAVAFRIENPSSGPDLLHNIWTDQKIKDGWLYGEKEDKELRLSPYLLPFGRLPEFQQKKGQLFNAIVDALAF